MSEIFSILGVATSGMGAYKTWLNAVADNVANMNNVVRTDEPAFQERFVEVRPMMDEDGLGDGVMVTGEMFADPDGRVRMIFSASFGFEDFPTTYLIGPDATIRQVWVGYRSRDEADIARAIVDLLKEAKAVPAAPPAGR